MDKNQRTYTGKVVSDKMDKTIVVSVYSYKTHAKYNKKYNIPSQFNEIKRVK